MPKDTAAYHLNGKTEYQVETTGAAREVLESMAAEAATVSGCKDASWFKKTDPGTGVDDLNPNSTEGIYLRFNGSYILAAATDDGTFKNDAMRDRGLQGREAAAIIGSPIRNILEAAGATEYDGDGERPRLRDTPEEMARILDWSQERTAEALSQGTLSGLKREIATMETIGDAAEKLEADERKPTLREMLEAADPNLAQRLFGEGDRLDDWSKGFDLAETTTLMYATVASDEEYIHATDSGGMVQQAVQALMTENHHARFQYVQDNPGTHTGRPTDDAPSTAFPGGDRQILGLRLNSIGSTLINQLGQDLGNEMRDGGQMDAAGFREKADGLNAFYQAIGEGIIPECPDWATGTQTARALEEARTLADTRAADLVHAHASDLQAPGTDEWLASLTPGDRQRVLAALN